jgi:hypothetical protein
MTNSSRLLGVVLAFASIAAPAAAQDDPRFALLASFPSPTVSFQWELSERFAIRFEGSYSYRDETTETTSGGLPELVPATPNSIILETATRNETTTHNGAIGVAGIVTLHRTDQMRLYVAPRISITRSTQRITSETTLTRIPPGLPPSVIGNLFPRSETFESSSTSPSAGASFGAVTNIHRRLAIFGEAGFTWNRSDAPLTTIVIGSTLSPLRDTEAKRTTVNTRAVGGVMILF